MSGVLNLDRLQSADQEPPNPPPQLLNAVGAKYVARQHDT